MYVNCRICKNVAQKKICRSLNNACTVQIVNFSKFIKTVYSYF